MTAQRWTIASITGGLILLALVTTAVAQRPGPGGPGWGMFGPGFGPKVITGEPFSAQSIRTFSDTLNGGNTISRTECAIIARDSAGDTYEAVTPNVNQNPPSCSSATAKMITIKNVGAGEVYFIDVAKGTYRQMTLRTPPEGSGQFQGPRQGGRNGNGAQKTDLGASTIAGVTANGTQITRTILAGQMGNSQPITITSTTWFAQPLGIVVESSRVDPMRGNENYVLNNITTSEPSASLFVLPSGLTLQQGRGRGPR